jgi:hypothetical protein
MEGGGSGNVFGYNYAEGVTTTEDLAWLSGDMITHGAHPYMNLWEGNVISKLSLDNTWGTASHNTSFRNVVRGSGAGKTTGRFAVDIQAQSDFNHVVGSVVGTAGDTGLVEPTTIPSTATKVSYRLGFNTHSSSTRIDSTTAATTYIHGTWDAIGNAITWDDTNPDHTLPDSLYLAGEPGWWGTMRWPPHGTDLSPMTGTLPAQFLLTPEPLPEPGTPGIGSAQRQGKTRLGGRWRLE